MKIKFLTWSLLFFFMVSPVLVSNNLKAADITAEILEEYQSLLNDSKKALNGGDYLTAEKNLNKASILLWNNSPLQLVNITFTERKAQFYGDIAPIKEKTFHPGDKLFLYSEPKNYLIETDEEGKYQMDITADMKLISENGKIIFHDPEFIRFKKESSRPNREVFFNMTFNLSSGMESGEYIIKVKVSDQLSEKEKEVESKFDFVK